MSVLIDTHAHLYASEFDTDRAKMIQRAIDAGVKYMFLPNIDSTSIQGMYDLVSAFPEHCFAMMGLHPCYVKDNYIEELAIAQKALEDTPCKLYAVGEIGLDYYWDLTHKDAQQEALRTQIEWAKEKQLPIVLHCREAFEDTHAIVKAAKNEHLSGVFHCFSGTAAEAQQIIELGDFYIGVGGVATYKKSGVAEALAATPNILDYLVLETDAPYMTPVPVKYKNRRNESANVKVIAEKIAKTLGVSLETVAQKTTENAQKLFKVQLTT
ncbi:MAG: TatD family hydrolase [Chitinophagales bacterium]